MNAGKWIKLGIIKKEHEKIRSRARQKAKGILAKKYKKQYLKIVRTIMREEYNYYLNIVKGGLK